MYQKLFHFNFILFILAIITYLYCYYFSSFVFWLNWSRHKQLKPNSIYQEKSKNVLSEENKIKIKKNCIGQGKEQMAALHNGLLNKPKFCLLMALIPSFYIEKTISITLKPCLTIWNKNVKKALKKLSKKKYISFL